MGFAEVGLSNNSFPGDGFTSLVVNEEVKGEEDEATEMVGQSKEEE